MRYDKINKALIVTGALPCGALLEFNDGRCVMIVDTYKNYVVFLIVMCSSVILLEEAVYI